MTKTFLLMLLTEMTFLVGSPGQLFFESPMVVDHLDGNYQRLAFCTYQQLARREGQLLMTDFHEQRTVRIALCFYAVVSTMANARLRRSASNKRPQGEAGNALGREYYEHGAQPGQGYRNGYRRDG
jgi:hypothetical protein